ncbi:hypothetical protein ASU91_23475 [Enterobacter hormaechei subsp. steigerwaltii]|uniref:hypothetical protein n=1 Tax=Enterobacter hormaechei TaxID=158836 RepID=UPI0005EDB7F1|nr:hypothetical protein [Enterobacter hormaechei]KJL77796.1 hypothetical protein SS35_01500 [Enterobacter hormaechei subsp. steigerwaltii]KJL89727.1 hypothetical protein SS24_01340 [Enterobacter hormaechei subsp. steigerwaltii]KJL92143.1 hypothetical protein SS61_03300 [Enterobacter hormaechei subsp. steigerwaltii]KJW87431.1 hypothetical protein SG70_01645 [Enterobacter hormaechei subsp. steigerwaltii]KJW87737.1 hypothetical protein SG68_03625 [Enterobacter hormaechei subsp. steigerwaltii]
MLSKNIKITDVKLTSNAPFFSNRAISGKFQKRFTGVQFFELEFSLNYQSEQTAEVKRFIAMHQQAQPFEFDLSYQTKYEGTAQGLLRSQQNAAPGARQVTLGTFAGVLEAGTIVQFQNHSKLYTVTEDVQTGGQLKLFPNLRAQVQLGEEIKYRSPKGRFVLTNESYPYDIKSLSKIQLKATEVI